jgi:anthranilate phosphoribosyltransferase
MNINQAIKAMISKKDLNESEMLDVMNSIMTGQTTDAQIGAFLIGLSMKGETIEEITASAKVMRSLATSVELRSTEYLVDTCGTLLQLQVARLQSMAIDPFHQNQEAQMFWRQLE